MKKTLAILLALFVCFTISAKADGNTATKTGKFTVTVIIPLDMTPENDGIMELGYINPGQTKTLGADKALSFAISGEPGYQYSIEGTGSTSAQEGAITLNNMVWQVQNTGSWTQSVTTITNFPYTGNLATGTGTNAGKAWVRVFPTSVSASAQATSAEVEFEFTLTCSYTFL